MKNLILSTLLAAAVAGCSSGGPSSQPDQFKSMTGGQSVGDITSLYWYTEKLQLPFSASDYVTSGDYGWYQSEYRWRDGNLKEVVREGEQRQENEQLVPYTTHLRFNDAGEAVYQQYRRDGRVLPMTPDQIAHVLREASALREVVKGQDAKGESLYQGYWDGKKFVTCEGETYKRLEFNQTLPTFVINRLASLDNYAAFVANAGPSKLTVVDIFMLHDEDFDCLQPAQLIDD
jgi:hypothetical protein